MLAQQAAQPKPGTFTSETSQIAVRKGHSAGVRGIIRQLVEMQDLLLKDCRNPNVPAGYRAQCARAWDVLEERKRILRMKPKPRDIDVSDSVSRRKAKRMAPALILEAPPSQQDIEPSKESLP